jgi:hypothetical protein
MQQPRVAPAADLPLRSGFCSRRRAFETAADLQRRARAHAASSLIAEYLSPEAIYNGTNAGLVGLFAWEGNISALSRFPCSLWVAIRGGPFS